METENVILLVDQYGDDFYLFDSKAEFIKEFEEQILSLLTEGETEEDLKDRFYYIEGVKKYPQVKVNVKIDIEME